MDEHYRSRPMTTRDYIISVLDVTTEVATCVFEFCVRNYKRNIQPVVYPLCKVAVNYTIK